MDDWSVSVDVAAGRGQRRPPRLEDKLEALMDELGERAGVVHSVTNGRRYGARFCVSAEAPASAVAEALEVFHKAVANAALPAWAVVEVQAQTMGELKRQNAEPNFPELVGVTELAALLGVTRQRASALAKSQDFPASVAELRAGPVWTRPSVERFVDRWQRRVGHPPGR
jgi:hypothetical protein